VGGLTVDCNNRTHEGALQSEAPLSAQRWYASGAVFISLARQGAQSEPLKAPSAFPDANPDAIKVLPKPLD